MSYLPTPEEASLQIELATLRTDLEVIHAALGIEIEERKRLTAELEISERNFQRMLASRADAIDELAKLRPVVRDAIRLGLTPSGQDYGRAWRQLAATIDALDHALRARLLE